uniref:Uncharacterized protein n=1 Tax=viral metagenome TaxID=1070528 RepID=A0A6C0AF06_9ZZZZ
MSVLKKIISKSLISENLMPKHEKLLKKMISELLSNKYVDIVYNIFNTLDNHIIFKNLVFMNTCSKIGKFALTYNKLLNEYLTKNKLNKLRNLLSDPKTIEYDSNEFLTDSQKEKINQEINTEISATNLLFEKILFMNDPIPRHIFSKGFQECKNDICLLDNEKNNLVLDPNKKFIWLSEKISEINYGWCFKIEELLIILNTSKINPYTSKKFSKEVIDPIKLKYRLEYLLCKKYVRG